MHLREQFGRTARQTRIALDLTQQAVADALGTSRSFIARVELGTARVSLGDVERMSKALGMRVTMTIAPPIFLRERRVSDLVHARCVAYVARRLKAEGWLVAREVDVSSRGVHGWIDLLAFDPVTRTLLIIEVKTRLDDLGGLRRQVGWYERRAWAAARTQGWQPRVASTWLVGLASDELESALRAERDAFASEFPLRAPDMLNVVVGTPGGVRGIALVDPVSRRRAWLIRTRLDGRRSELPYRNYADAARRLRR